MDGKVIIGLDLARRAAHQAVILRAPGAPPEARKVEATADDLDRLLAEAGGADRCVVVMEPTGMAWLPVGAWLTHRGCTVVRVDTRSAHEFRKFVRRDVKSDRVDAEALARMYLANPNAMRTLVLPPAARFGLDRLVRMRADLVGQRTRVFSQLLTALEVFAPALERVVGAADGQFTPTRQFLVRRFCIPHVAVAAGVEGLRQAIEGAELNEETEAYLEMWAKAARRDAALWAPLRDAGACAVDFDVAAFQIGLHLDRYTELDRHIGELDERIKAAYRSADQSRLLESLPGIGPVIAPAMLAAVGDVRRFRDGKAFASWTGITPRKNQTGISDRGGQRISKAGNRLIRQYLHLAADAARRSDPQLAAWYARRTAAGMHHNAALTAIANRLAHRVYAVLKRAAEGAKSPHYVFRDDDGQELEPREATRLTRSRFPSKAAKRRAEQAKKKADRASTAHGTGQSVDSPRRSHEVPVREESNPSPA